MQQGELRLDGECFKHICGVCRQGVGSRFEVLGAFEGILLVEITHLARKWAECKVLSQRPAPTLGRPFLHLHICVPRFSVMDSLVARSVELGVHSLHPMFSDNAFVKSSGKLGARPSRWQKIMHMSMAQTGRAQPMHLETCTSFETSLARVRHDGLMLFACEHGMTHGLRPYLQAEKSTGTQAVHIWVGGEGGWSQREKDIFARAGIKAISLGEQVLRVETACLTLVSILRYEYGKSER